MNVGGLSALGRPLPNLADEAAVGGSTGAREATAAMREEKGEGLLSGGMADGAARASPGRGVGIEGLVSMVRRRAVATALKTSKGMVLPIKGMARMGMSGSTNAAAIFSAMAWDKGTVSGDTAAESTGGGEGEARIAAAAPAAATGEPVTGVVTVAVAAVWATEALDAAAAAAGVVVAGGDASMGQSSGGLGERRGRVTTGGGGAVCCGGGE